LSAAAVVDRLQGLSHYARTLLLGPHDPVAAPIRAELFGVQRFEQHGRSLARAQVVEEDHRHGNDGAPFFPRVDENLASLREAFDYIALISLSGRYVSPAAEWLLDNFHLVEAQLQQIHDGVPRSYYARLPKLAAPPLAGLPRVYGIAWAYVAHTDSVLNQALFTAFLNAYQEVDELTLGELWALPTTLRVVLLENLRRVAETIAENKVAREIAHAAWDAAPHLTAQDLDVLYRALQSHGLQDSYLTQLWQRLPVERGEDMPALVRWTEQHCPNGPALIGEAQNAQAAANLTVGNIITTLRMIGQVEWSDLIEPVSRSLRVLRELPSFANESERTRQQITHAMEQVARSGERSEREVAQAVVQLAAGAPADDAGAETDRADGTAGYYLFGQGRPALVAALQAQRKPGRSGPTESRPARNRRGWRLPVYIGAVALGTALLLAAVVHGLPHRDDWTTVVTLVLLAWPLSEALLALAQRIMAESVRVQALPRLDFANGIPERHRALVVMPTLLASAANNAQLAHRLELHWLANREAHAQFALLTDWADALQASLPEDAVLLDDALRRIAALNAKYPVAPDAAPRFLLLHRPRTWSDTERRWMGWERKRGKLEMLVRLLATGDAGGFLPLAPGLRLAPGRTPYVLTLDSDTGLPPGALRDLVSVAAHPLNAPRSMCKAGAWWPASASCSRASSRPFRCRTSARSSTGCSRASAGSTPTAAAPPTSTRTCSAAARSPARAC
jgi:cyclic beta-1,2-glucan synthetase